MASHRALIIGRPRSRRRPRTNRLATNHCRQKSKPDESACSLRAQRNFGICGATCQTKEVDRSPCPTDDDQQAVGEFQRGLASSADVILSHARIKCGSGF